MATLRTLPQLSSIDCFDCLDTKVALSLYGPEPCAHCATLGRTELSRAATMFRDTVWLRRGQGKSLDLQTLNVGRVLVHATVEMPVSRATLELLMGLNDRKAKSIVETLRKDWLLPIGAARGNPKEALTAEHTGYFFISTAKDFLDWALTYRAQAITSLATLYRLQRKQFPQLSGQQEMDFASVIESELREELR